MTITPCYSCYTDELFEEYPFLYSIKIYTVDPYDLPKDVLAATDGKNYVFIRRDLPLLLFRHALFHEFEHIVNIYASESEVENEARKKSGLPSYIV